MTQKKPLSFCTIQCPINGYQLCQVEKTVVIFTWQLASLELRVWQIYQNNFSFF